MAEPTGPHSISCFPMGSTPGAPHPVCNSTHPAQGHKLGQLALLSLTPSSLIRFWAAHFSLRNTTRGAYFRADLPCGLGSVTGEKIERISTPCGLWSPSYLASEGFDVLALCYSVVVCNRCRVQPPSNCGGSFTIICEGQ